MPGLGNPIADVALTGVSAIGGQYAKHSAEITAYKQASGTAQQQINQLDSEIASLRSQIDALKAQYMKNAANSFVNPQRPPHASAADYAGLFG